MTKWGQPISQVTIAKPVSTGINYNSSYEAWQAFVECGATMDELQKFEEGAYPVWFVAKVMAWNRNRLMIENTVQDSLAK